MKIVNTLLLILAVAGISETVSASALDSLIVECRIMDAETSVPVSARIRYESEPYGSKVGFRKGASCEFRMEPGEVFEVHVTAEGYMSANLEIDYARFAGSGKIIEEIALAPSKVGSLMRLESLVFPQGSDEITPEAYEELDRLVETMKHNPGMKIQLEGHTDYRGDKKLNMKLSEDRVKATREYLIERGIDRSRITIKAFGGTMPLSTENSPQAHAMNRRVEVRIIEN